MSERETLKKAAMRPVDLFHLERVTTLLDRPSMSQVRKQFLGIIDANLVHSETLGTVVPSRPFVDWAHFDVLPVSGFPRKEDFLKLIATPKHPSLLTIDGDLLDSFRERVVALLRCHRPSPSSLES